MKELEITLQHLESAVVLHAAGRVDSNTAPELQEPVLRAAEAPTGAVELDLADDRSQRLADRSGHPVRRDLPDHTQGQLRFLKLLHFLRPRRAGSRRPGCQSRTDAADKPNFN